MCLYLYLVGKIIITVKWFSIGVVILFITIHFKYMAVSVCMPWIFHPYSNKRLLIEAESVLIIILHISKSKGFASIDKILISQSTNWMVRN